MPDPTLRIAKPSDAPGIAAVQVETWRVSYADIVPAAYFETFTVEKRSRRWEEILSGSPSTTIVALLDHEVIGFCSGGACKLDEAVHDGEIYALYVHPDAQGRGVGRSLFLWMAEYLLESGYEGLEVWAFAAAAARGFYRHLGGVELDAQRTHDLTGEAIPMVGFGYPSLANLVAASSD